MKSSQDTIFTRKGTLINAGLTFLFFLFFTWILQPAVPATTPLVVIAISAYTSFCLSGVFFISLHMFQAVWVDQKRRSL